MALVRVTERCILNADQILALIYNADDWDEITGISIYASFSTEPIEITAGTAVQRFVSQVEKELTANLFRLAQRLWIAKSLLRRAEYSSGQRPSIEFEFAPLSSAIPRCSITVQGELAREAYAGFPGLVAADTAQ